VYFVKAAIPHKIPAFTRQPGCDSLSEEVIMAVSESAVLRMREKRIYLIAALLFPLIVLIGFGRTYYLKGFTAAPPLSSYIVHIHAVLMTAWVALFIAQVFLIRTKNIKVHQKLGMLSIGLGVLIIITGFFTALGAAKNGAPSTPPGIDRMSFMIVPMFDLVMFIILFGAAIYYRKRAANHKRLMLLTMINFLPPAIARFPIEGWMALGPIVFFGIPTVILIFAVIYDRLQQGRFNKLFVYGSLLLFISYPLRLMLSGTETWMSFARWLTQFSPV
jgi:hypothetical protein